MSLMRTCTKCYLQKLTKNLVGKTVFLGKRHAVCKECPAKRSNDWYQDNKARQKENVRRNNQFSREQARQYSYEHLRSHPCGTCGESVPVYLNSTMKVRKKMRDQDSLEAELPWMF